MLAMRTCQLAGDVFRSPQDHLGEVRLHVQHDADR
jgi:hypothetical protein